MFSNSAIASAATTQNTDILNTDKADNSVREVEQDKYSEIDVSISSDGHNYQVNAHMFVNLSPTEFIFLLDSAIDDCSWIASCVSVTIEQIPADNQRVLRTIFSSPWPFKDREMHTLVTHFIDHQSGKLDIDISQKPDAQVSSSEYVLIEQMKARWEIIPITDTQSELSYSGYANLGGMIPAFLVDNLLLRSTKQTFANIQLKANRDKQKWLGKYTPEVPQ